MHVVQLVLLQLTCNAIVDDAAQITTCGFGKGVRHKAFLLSYGPWSHLAMPAGHEQLREQLKASHLREFQGNCRKSYLPRYTSWNRHTPGPPSKRSARGEAVWLGRYA